MQAESSDWLRKLVELDTVDYLTLSLTHSLTQKCFPEDVTQSENTEPVPQILNASEVLALPSH